MLAISRQQLTDVSGPPSLLGDMKDGLHERLAALLADVCGAPASSLGPEAAPGVTPGWDSVATLGFIAAVEDELGISITTAEAMAIKSLGDMVRLARSKGVAP
jgi:acyl carrier protein